MNASVLSYPGFQALPKGTKQMLIASEEYFFEQGVPFDVSQIDAAQIARMSQGFKALPRKVAECAADSALSLRRFRAAELWRQLGNGWAT
jgi:hypothetical protein